MALQNRVTPFGEIVAIPERGTMMGNRGGRLHHNDRQELAARHWASKQWITCLLEFKGRQRAVMSPNHYTELFFLDEATAFAAGHRPCAECRRPDFERFMAAWTAANSSTAGFEGRPRAGQVDTILHGERVHRDGTQVTHLAPLDQLPQGTFVKLDGAPWLVHRDGILRWTPSGYRESRPLVQGPAATVITPRPLVQAFRHGYSPAVHPSALLR